MTMMSTEISTAVTAPAEGAQLSELLLRVARRADELARRGVLSRTTDRWLWLRAEFEIFELLERACPCRPLGVGEPGCMEEAGTSL